MSDRKFGFSPGHQSFAGRWGVIAKCPHCEKVNIVRLAPKQATCGGEACGTKNRGKRKR